ncbi:MAG: hypothetical protein AB1345_12320 [Chloroflexota bacterium]
MKTLRFFSTAAIIFALLSLLLLPDNIRAQEYVYQEDFEDGQAQD